MNAPGVQLTAEQIRLHLDLNPWQVTRMLQSGVLEGRKVTGAGSWGRGGAWRVPYAGYLDWLHIPAEERGQLRPGQLPRIVREQELADLLKVKVEKVREVRMLLGLPVRRFGRGIAVLAETNAELIAAELRKERA